MHFKIELKLGRNICPKVTPVKSKIKINPFRGPYVITEFSMQKKFKFSWLKFIFKCCYFYCILMSLREELASASKSNKKFSGCLEFLY